MKHFTRCGHDIDVSAINAQLATHPYLWDSISARRTVAGTPHTGMTDIWVRYNDLAPYVAQGDTSKLNDPHVPVWYPSWYALPALRPLVFQQMSAFQGEMLGGVLITKVPPGHTIEPHKDFGWHVDYYEKFYLSLSAAPGARFYCQDDGEPEAQWIEPAVGELWHFDNRKTHWVTNDSDTDRVTLITCIRTDLFRRTHP